MFSRSKPDYLVGGQPAFISGDLLISDDRTLASRKRTVNSDGTESLGPWLDLIGKPDGVKNIVQTGATMLGGGLDTDQAIKDAESSCDFVLVFDGHLEKYAAK